MPGCLRRKALVKLSKLVEGIVRRDIAVGIREKIRKRTRRARVVEDMQMVEICGMALGRGASFRRNVTVPTMHPSIPESFLPYQNAQHRYQTLPYAPCNKPSTR